VRHDRLPHDSSGRFGWEKREAGETAMFQKGDVTSSQSRKAVKFNSNFKNSSLDQICITILPEHTRAPLCTGGTDLSDKSASSAAQGHDRLIRSDSIGKAWKREGIFPALTHRQVAERKRGVDEKQMMYNAIHGHISSARITRIIKYQRRIPRN